VKFIGEIALVVFLISIVGCEPEIGDSCSNDTDCGTSENIICDTTQPGGYCIQLGCHPDSCPEEADCVAVIEGEEREFYCLKGCNRDADCRREYICFIPKDDTSPIQIIDYEPNYIGVCIPK